MRGACRYLWSSVLLSGMSSRRQPDQGDVDITDDAIPNNFRALLQAHPDIRLIGFNSGTAAKLYERHVLSALTDTQRTIARTTLPSTSPAHAGLSFAEKAARWSAIFSDHA
jgi:TDG/mug DNA glycosylase family protein